MQIQYTTIDNISCEDSEYSEKLKSSLECIGLNFPIHVKQEEHGYICVDGKKRLNAIRSILQNDPKASKFQKIPILIVSRARTAPPYHLHNHH